MSITPITSTQRIAMLSKMITRVDSTRQVQMLESRDVVHRLLAILKQLVQTKSDKMRQVIGHNDHNIPLYLFRWSNKRLSEYK